MANEIMNTLIDSWQDEIFRKLKTWIAIESVAAPKSAPNAPFGDNVRKSLDLFLQDASEMGFETLDLDGFCGHAQYGQGEKTMGILGHLDIVPLGDGWTHDPLGAEIDGGRVFGRGVADDKGPLLGALYALRAVKASGLPMKHAVRVIAGCDEETGMTDMAHYKATVSVPDYGFSPDAEFPLINIEKGGLGLLLVAAMKPSDGALRVLSMHAGERCNVVPGTATAVVERADLQDIQGALEKICKSHDKFDVKAEAMEGSRVLITATGVSAHASMPHLGVNAAGMLLIALAELGAGQPVQALANVIGMEGDGKSLGIAVMDELSGPLTCNLGILRYDGQAVEAQLDIRYPLCADEQQMCGQACMALSKHKIALLRRGGTKPLHVPVESEVVQGLLAAYHEQTGLPAYAIAIGGGTYSKTMPNTVAFGPNFPGDIETAHMPDEFVYVDKFMQSIKIMAHAIMKLAGA